MVTLLFLSGPLAGKKFELDEGDFLIGRRPACDVAVPHMGVSRRHARLHYENSEWGLEDLGSNNGTYVNGERIQWVKLCNDDEITISKNRIRISLPEPDKTASSDDVSIVDLKNPRIYLGSTDSWSVDTPLKEIEKSDIHGDVHFLQRKLAALSSILEIAANTYNPGELLESVLGKLLDVFPQADSVGVLVEDERSQELRVQCQKHREHAFGAGLQVPSTIVEHVVKDRQAILLHDAAKPTVADMKAARDSGVDIDDPRGTRMGAPLQAHDHNYGVIYVECTTGSFRREDMELLSSVATQVGLAIHAARMHQRLLFRQRLERDVVVARQIQRSLLPKTTPTVSGLEFAVHYEPAYQIGGDFYDFIWHDDTHLGIVVGDVAGKAISAALYMARLTRELRSRAGIVSTPSRVLRRVNEAMLDIGDEGMFATLIYAIYDLEQRTLTFTNAGHVPPLLRRDRRVVPLESDRAHVTPLGIMGGMEVGEARVQLHAGDLLVLTTDGVHEARDARGNEYGSKRLSRMIHLAGSNPTDVVEGLLRDIDAHATSETQDDVTILAMTVGSESRHQRADDTPPVGNPIVEDTGAD